MYIVNRIIVIIISSSIIANYVFVLLYIALLFIELHRMMYFCTYILYMFGRSLAVFFVILAVLVQGFCYTAYCFNLQEQ